MKPQFSDFTSRLNFIPIVFENGGVFPYRSKDVPQLSDILNILKKLKIKYDKILFSLPNDEKPVEFYSKSNDKNENNQILKTNLPVPSICYPMKKDVEFSYYLNILSLNNNFKSIQKIYQRHLDNEQYNNPSYNDENDDDNDFQPIKARIKAIARMLDNQWESKPNESFFCMAENAYHATLQRREMLKTDPLLEVISICEPKAEYRGRNIMIRVKFGFSFPNKIPVNQYTFPMSSDQTADYALLFLFNDRIKTQFQIFGLEPKNYIFVIPGTNEIIAGNHSLASFVFIQKFLDSSKSFLDLMVNEKDKILNDRFLKTQAEKVINSKINNIAPLTLSNTEIFHISHQNYKNQKFIPHNKVSADFIVILEGFLLKRKGLEYGKTFSFNIDAFIYVGSTQFEAIDQIQNYNLYNDNCSSMKDDKQQNKMEYFTTGIRFKFNTHICQLPRYSKLVIKLESCMNRKQIICYASIPIFNRDGFLQTGKHSLNFISCNEVPPTPGIIGVTYDSDNIISSSFGSVKIALPTYSRTIKFALLDIAKPSDFQEILTREEIEKQNISTSPLSKLSNSQSLFIYNNRWRLVKYSDFLPLYLRVIQLHSIESVSELPLLLNQWENPSNSSLLYMLSGQFMDPIIRKYVVLHLESWPNETISLFLLQLVQALQFEPEDDSELALFLLKRAILEPKYLGMQFFWCLKSLFDFPWIHSRILWMLTTLVAFSDDWTTFVFSYLFNERQLDLCKNYSNQNIKNVRNILREYKLTDDTQLPIDPKLIVKEYVPEKCFFADSAKKPLFLTFKSSDPFCSNDLIQMMVKVDDDLRQDQITLQLMKVMDDIWKNHGLNMQLRLYSVLSTGRNQGIIEIVPHAVTISSIQKKYGNIRGAIKNDVILNWLNDRIHDSKGSFQTKYNFPKQSPERKSIKEMRKNKSFIGEINDFSLNQSILLTKEIQLKNYMYSMAGYIVATYVLGIGDRHCSNMMIQEDGHFFHIDFGHFLGHFKTALGGLIDRESNLFYFSESFAYVLGGIGSPKYKEFEQLCCDAFNIIRANHEIIVTLLFLMLGTGIPELSSKDDLKYIENALMLDLTDDQASNKFKEMLKTVQKMKKVTVSDFCHLTQH